MKLTLLDRCTFCITFDADTIVEILMVSLRALLAQHTNVSLADIRPSVSDRSVFECSAFYLEVRSYAGELHILYLCAYAQGDGFGRTVVAAVLEYCRKTQRVPIITSVLDTALSFWQHMGFVEHPQVPDHLVHEAYAELVAAA